MSYQGLFVGLTTLDCIYLSDRHPQPNQKLVAKDYLTAAGGPATNAAVAFSSFNNRAKLLSVLGQHPLSHLIRSDLADWAIDSLDLIPQQSTSPPVSSIVVTAATGERSVISINALKSQGNRGQIPADILQAIDIVLIDGHQIDVSLAIAAMAQTSKIPLVLDGGSWKPGLESILDWVDYAICSANFFPPGCSTIPEVVNFLQARGIKHIAISQGELPILYLDRGRFNTIPVPKIQPVDTLGAGDVFHGAFCHYILEENFATALELSARVATKSCQFFGTRSWLAAKS